MINLFERIPEDSVRNISSYLTPSEKDQMITLTLLSMDDFTLCIECDVHVAAWNGRCYECHNHHVCPECCVVPNHSQYSNSLPSNDRYYQSVGVFKKIPNVCSSCYLDPIPSFSCFFCQSLFFALDGHRIVIESDNQSYEQVICMKCIEKAFSVVRWKQLWVTISIRPSSYGAKLWCGPPLPLPDYFNYMSRPLTYRSGLLLFMQQSKSIGDKI